MARWQWLWVGATALLALGCDKHRSKPDPTKGVVAGIVICSDTGKPARFAQVNLTPVPIKHADPSDSPPLTPIGEIDTGLDGRFRMEAIPPGDYYAFGTLDGYLDPERGIDFGKLTAKGTTSEQEQDAIEQWKDQLVEVKVAVHRVSEITIELHRAAAIEGTVNYDDGTPAIGMHFQLFRKNAKKEWATVGLPLLSDWSINSTSDSHGHYALDDLEPGEYNVCAMMPVDSEDVAPRICSGNVFRRKNATTVKVSGGETVRGIDIEIPLSGLHTVSGHVEAAADGHAPSQATVTLLYADDREQVRKVAIDKDGSFLFEYVPEDNYILRIGEAEDTADPNDSQEQGDSQNKSGSPQPMRHYLTKEMPLRVQSDMKDLDVPLTDQAAAKPQ
ncbi:MAG TPA: hypothetical protein VGI45_07565 [Terracidiphilus sp.]